MPTRQSSLTDWADSPLWKSPSTSFIALRPSQHVQTQAKQQNQEKGANGHCPRMGSGGYNCIRYTFFTLNVIMWLAGCGLLGVGAWLHVVHAGYIYLLPHFTILRASSLFIAAGCMAMVVGFFGYCGSWMQNRCLLMTYFILVLVIFSLELTAGILAYINRNQLSEIIKEELKANIKYKYSTNNAGGIAETWRYVQTNFQCCGVDSHRDWYLIDAWPAETWVPDSCCLLLYANKTNCGKTLEKSYFHEEGCFSTIQLWLAENLYIVGVVGLVSAFIQLFGLLSSIILFCSLKSGKNNS